MSNKIFFLSTKRYDGKPISFRVSAFKLFFHDYLEIKVFEKTSSMVIPISLSSINNNNNFLFVTMPPFRNFWLFLIPGVKIILDIRDGWSIAQASGYGGVVNKQPVKSYISRIIERFAIRRSYLTITCTPGLQVYLSELSGNEVLLIPNGISDEDISLIDSMRKPKFDKPSNSDSELIFCCAGQFSEYGKDKVRHLLQVISKRYSNRKLVIKLIGSNESHNNWVDCYFHEITQGYGSVEILPRVNKKELFAIMAESDYGLVVIRDPKYDLGTKVYDYIGVGLPIVNYFDKPNNFTTYFNNFLDVPFDSENDSPEIRRSVLIKSVLSQHIKGFIK